MKVSSNRNTHSKPDTMLVSQILACALLLAFEQKKKALEVLESPTKLEAASGNLIV